MGMGQSGTPWNGGPENGPSSTFFNILKRLALFNQRPPAVNQELEQPNHPVSVKVGFVHPFRNGDFCCFILGR